jgi:hypothetical protein
MNRWTALLSQGCVLAALALSLPACDRFGDYCAQMMDCEGGNDLDVEACVAEAEESEEHASLWDCDEWFDAYFECAEAESDCDNDRYGVHDDSCEDEEQDYGSCM